MSANTLPGGLRQREALAVRRDNLAALLVRLMLDRDFDGKSWYLAAKYADYRDLGLQIAALGEVVMGPGDWRRATVQRLPGIR